MKKKIFKKNNILNKGFTLIETLVAIIIFVSGVLVMITVSAGGINSTKTAQNKATATFLADEGLELVRNIRDNYALSGVNGGIGWSDFSNKIVEKCSVACKIGPRFELTNLDDASFAACFGDCEVLSMFGKLAYYGYYEDLDNLGTAIPTPFIRTITVNYVLEDTNPNILKVTSKVEWKQGTNSYNVTVNGYLYNWLNQ